MDFSATSRSHFLLLITFDLRRRQGERFLALLVQQSNIPVALHFLYFLVSSHSHLHDPFTMTWFADL